MRLLSLLFSLLFSILGFALLLTACGQKGPLYLPESDEAKLESVSESQSDSATH